MGFSSWIIKINMTLKKEKTFEETMKEINDSFKATIAKLDEGSEKLRLSIDKYHERKN